METSLYGQRAARVQRLFNNGFHNQPEWADARI
jgi:hypothetical protein